jgi:hypothetical protein
VHVGKSGGWRHFSKFKGECILVQAKFSEKGVAATSDSEQ